MKHKTNWWLVATAIIVLIPPKNQADRAAYRNLAIWVQQEILKGRFNNEIYKRVLDYANEARGGRKPIAVLFSTLKRELRYKAMG